MAVLLVGPETLSEVRALADAVSDRGSEPRLVPVTDWPGERTALAPGDDEFLLGSSLDWENVEGAYFHVHVLFRPEGATNLDGFEVEENVEPGLNQLREHRSVFESLARTVESRGIPVVPRPSNAYLQERKPWQLDLFEREGLPVPDTVFTNDPETVRSFCDDHDRVVYKPVSAGAPPAEVGEEDLDDERLAHLETAPVQFQEFVPGDDLRVYVLDGEVVGAIRYESERFSFKLDQMAGERVESEAATLSEDIEETALRAAEAVGLRFGAADVRRRPDGGHALLEVNQAPAFAAADAYSDQRVAEALADYLTDD